MHSTVQISATVAILTALSACGGAGGSALDQYEARYEADLEKGTALFNTPGTAWNAMPANGSANYNGGAVILIDRDDTNDLDDILILGDTDITANFRAGTMTGTIDNMVGATNITENDADIADVTGEIEIGGSTSIVGDDEDDNFTNRPNDWYADYYGNIGFNGDSYEVEGGINGQFVGTRANPSNGQSPARGIIGESDDGFATINGEYETNEAFVSLELYGEN